MQSSSRLPLVSRRRFAQSIAVGGAALALAPIPSVSAAPARAQATADLASLGYPELKVTVTDSGFEDLPAETPAGRYLLSVTSAATKGPGTAAFVSPTPIGKSVSEVLGPLTTFGGEEGLPLSHYQMYYAGGGSANPGATAQSVIDLVPGEYAVWSEDPSATQEPAILNVTGDFPAEVQDPDAGLTVTLLDFKIMLDKDVTAGKHLVKVQNHGAQPHFLFIFKGPDTMTAEQVEDNLQAGMTGTPATDPIPEDAMMPVFFSATQSIGTASWHHLEIEPGTYMAGCFFPTAGLGLPHAMEGMTEIFKVAG